MPATPAAPCPSCGSPVEPRHDTGRPPVYCRPACRTAAYRARREAALRAEVERATVLLGSLTAAARMIAAD